MTREEREQAQVDGKYISLDSVIEWLKDKDIIKMSNQEWNARKELSELLIRHKADGEYISRQAVMDCYKKWQPYMATRLHEFEKELSELPSVAIPNKTEPKQALYEIRETIDDWWDKRIITNHTVYKMLRKLVEEKMYRD